LLNIPLDGAIPPAIVVLTATVIAVANVIGMQGPKSSIAPPPGNQIEILGVVVPTVTEP